MTHKVNKPSENSDRHMASVNLFASQENASSLLNQPYARQDSDEIELRDSEEDDDDCEFGTLEGNNDTTSGSRVPKTQTMFNQGIDQLN